MNDIRRIVRLVACIMLTCLSCAALWADDRVDFQRQIRPLLSDRCFSCHGPDDAQREGGFRLDQLQTAIAPADSGERPIVPGQPAASEVVARITSDDPALRMPPADSTKSLGREEIALIRRWIEEGAESTTHWSFTAPSRPVLPAVELANWPRQPLDRFILARLEAEQLEPSPAADRVTLIRRVTFDLTGLPPTTGEVEAFLRDHAPGAFARVVNRLLESPRYGEHLARYWLDAVRYGDTHGLHLDNYREIWPYRDWVINAFNRNLPFDQFALEQVAGDLIPNATTDQIVATGFNRCNVSTNEGGSIAEEVYVRNVVDRVVSFGTVFMGLTLECTRCHDHKFDPLTMRDFYSMFAYFNSIDGDPLDGNRQDHAPVIQVPTPSQRQAVERIKQQIARLEQQLRKPWPDLDANQRDWERQLATADHKMDDDLPQLTLGDWFTVGPFNDNRHYLTRKKHGPEGSAVSLEQEFRLATGSLARWIRRPDWVDGRVHRGLPGALSANFLYRRITASAATKATLRLGSGDGVKVYLNGAQVLNHDVTRNAAADQETREVALQAGENHLLVKVMNFGGSSGFFFNLDPRPAVPATIRELVAVEASRRTAEQQAVLREYFRFQVVESQAWRAVVAELAGQREALAAVQRRIPTSLVWCEAERSRPAHLLTRGEYDQPGALVTRRTPLSLPPMDAALPNDRWGLAQWLVDPRHPLTARVAVNRLWQQLFGTGLVRTSEDFGSQAEPPSHLELLDWLATEFVADEWNVKRLIKRLVMSATYRQSSRVSAELWRRDPSNRLLARGPRFRLDAEMLRDQALFVGGLLVEKIGGPSVKPPQPDGLWQAVGYSDSNTVKFVGDTAADRIYRRSLYTFVKRTSPPPQMTTLDSPSREACVMRRERTNSPMQSLLLLNEPQFVAAARGLARRAQQASAAVESQAAFMFAQVVSRPPNDDELQELVTGFATELAVFRADTDAARLLVVAAGGLDATSTEDATVVAEIAAWTVVASSLLNLDVSLTKN